MAGWLILYSSDVLGYVVCAPLLIALACFVFLANPNYRQVQLPVPASVVAPDAQATDLRLIITVLVSALFTWIGFSQVFVVLPAALNQCGQAWSVPLLFAANSGLVILLHLPVSRCVSAGETRLGLRPFSILILANGVFTSSFGLLSLGFGQSVTFAFLAIVLFTLGELIWDPLFERLTATNCSPNAKPSILAAISVVRGIAEATGAALGLLLVAADPVLPGAFLLGAVVCLTATIPLIHGRPRLASREGLPGEQNHPPVGAGVGLPCGAGTSTHETDPV